MICLDLHKSIVYALTIIFNDAKRKKKWLCNDYNSMINLFHLVLLLSVLGTCGGWMHKGGGFVIIKKGEFIRINEVLMTVK